MSSSEQGSSTAPKKKHFRPRQNNNRQGGGHNSSSSDSRQQGGQRGEGRQRGHGNQGNHGNHGNNHGGDGKQGGQQNKQFQKKRPFYQKKKQKQQSEGADQPSRAYVPIGEPEELTGILEVTSKGFGFVRTADNNWAPSDEAVYVSLDLIKQYNLRPFVEITGMSQRYERGHQMVSITAINGEDPTVASQAPHFEDLKAVNPTHRLSFETAATRYTMRTLDLIAPVARGQRGLIVAPPRTGKTTLLMHIAEAVEANYEDDMHLMILLIDERPEEVTEFRRSLPHAEIYASSNDSHVREHCRIAEMSIERAKRLVEQGKHVILLLDSITRLARAYNNVDRGSGRTMSGGLDARALEMPRRLFAAARNTRTAGSLTILATALIETNSRMDDLIFQEFKGTGNMELVLNRRIAEMYIYPAVDILKSGTRREELILPELMLSKMHLIRRALAGHKPVEAMERLLFFLQKSPTNAQMLLNLKTR